MSRHRASQFLRKFVTLSNFSIIYILILLYLISTCQSAGLLGNNDDGSLKLLDTKGTDALESVSLDKSKEADDNALLVAKKSKDFSKKEAKESDKTSIAAAKESSKTAEKQSEKNSKQVSKLEKEPESYKNQKGVNNYEIQEGEESEQACYAKLAGPKQCIKKEDCCTNFCIHAVGWCFRRPMDWPAGHVGAKGMWEYMEQETKPPCYLRLALSPKQCKENGDCCSNTCMENGWCYRNEIDWPNGHSGLKGFKGIGSDEPCYKKLAFAPKKCKKDDDCCTKICKDSGWCFREANDWPFEHPGKKAKSKKGKSISNSKESDDKSSAKVEKDQKDSDKKKDKTKDEKENSDKDKAKEKQ